MASELCKEEEYAHKVDVWATGILTYVLLAGDYPFKGSSREAIRQEVINREPNWVKLGQASVQAKQFVQACIRKQPQQRPNV